MHFAELIEHRRPWLGTAAMQLCLTQSFSEPANDVLERIIHAYRLASEAERERSVVRSGPWQRIRSEHMGELVSLMEAGQPAALAAYLRELPLRPAGHGFFQGKVRFEATAAAPLAGRRQLALIMDAICGLAEWLGVLGVVCPEGRPTIPSVPPTVEQLVDQIESATGLPLGVPQICAGLYGLAVADRVVHVRSACAVYAACRIRDWLGEHTGRALGDCRIGEIGPGIGLVPALLGRLGARHLMLVDLPELNAMQAYFLHQSMPLHQLVLFGEPMPADGSTIQILPDFEFLDGPEPGLDLVFNQDSLPELDLPTVRRYLDRIPKAARYFLSINQETRVPVGTPLTGGFLPSMLKNVVGYRCLYRMPAWCRAGYLEEMFLCGEGGGSSAPTDGRTALPSHGSP